MGIATMGYGQIPKDLLIQSGREFRLLESDVVMV